MTTKIVKRYYGDVDLVGNKLLNCLNALKNGGTTGQALIKIDDTDFNVMWGGPYAPETHGTWTPSYISSGSTFTCGGAGKWIRIGNLVTVGFNLYTLAATLGTAQVYIDGLPFAPAAGYAVGSLADVRNWVAAPEVIQANGGSALTLFKRSAAAGAQSVITAADMSIGAGVNVITGSLTYFV